MIRDGGLAAVAALGRIGLQVARIRARGRTALATQAGRVGSVSLSEHARQFIDLEVRVQVAIATMHHIGALPTTLVDEPLVDPLVARHG